MGCLKGFEALLRWKSEEFGFVLPADFIPLAEKNSHIIQIGEWFLETTCIQFKKMLEEYDTKKVLFINNFCT
ncbi:EAL domain-containing protein [Cellulosilyticum ruminicola]|uniref:EAL domain-containing protein n=1 Tax=Cellulosilyticum ruminicola TaxID=425254 RepID=UPI0009F9E1D9